MKLDKTYNKTLLNRNHPDFYKYRITGTNIKKYVFCSRTWYFSFFYPQTDLETEQMTYGTSQHIAELRNMVRRKIKIKEFLTLDDGKFTEQVMVSFGELAGKIDILYQDSESSTVIELKNSFYKTYLVNSSKSQIRFYALLFKLKYNLNIQYGGIYFIKAKRFVKFEISSSSLSRMNNNISEMQTIIEQQKLPVRNKNMKKCYTCEYKRFCNDT